MKLYRGYKKKPKFLTPTLTEEYEALNALRNKLHDENPDLRDLLRAMGIERMNRLLELQNIANPQFFTELENVARAFAGKKGFIVRLELDDAIAHEHNHGIQWMRNDQGKPMPVTNFVFPAKELSQHMKDWKFDLIDIENDRTERLGDDRTSSAELDRRPNILRDRITNIADLSPRDQQALSELRRRFGTPKSPPTDGESTKI